MSHSEINYSQTLQAIPLIPALEPGNSTGGLDGLGGGGLPRS